MTYYINNIILFCALSNLLNCHITNTPMIYIKNHKIKITVLSLFIISLIYSATHSRQSTETIQAKIEETVSDPLVLQELETETIQAKIEETVSDPLVLQELETETIQAKIEEFLYTEEHKLRDMYSQEQIKVTLSADVSNKIKKQLIMLYNLKEKWTPEAKDLIKSITVGEDGRLIVNISKGDLELKAGSCHKMNGNVYLTGIFLVNADYSYYGTNDYGCTQIIPVLLNLSREELNKFDANARFNKFTEIKNAITMRRP